jgi:hypothetical protein
VISSRASVHQFGGGDSSHTRRSPANRAETAFRLSTRKQDKARPPGSHSHTESTARRAWQWLCKGLQPRATSIADECGVSQNAVSRFIACARLYPLVDNRPTFWDAFQEATGTRPARLLDPLENGCTVADLAEPAMGRATVSVPRRTSGRATHHRAVMRYRIIPSTATEWRPPSTRPRAWRDGEPRAPPAPDWCDSDVLRTPPSPPPVTLASRQPPPPTLP